VFAVLYGNNWSYLNESNSINQETLRSLQDCEAPWQAVRHMQQSQAQAAARLGEINGTH
jgi:hypothetical protein